MRLIDADALMELIEKTHCTGCNNYNKVRCRACGIGDMLDYLDDAPTVDQWHYPSRGEMPNCTQRVLICYGQEEHIKIVWWRQDFHRFGDALPTEIIAWQYIVPPKEKA